MVVLQVPGDDQASRIVARLRLGGCFVFVFVFFFLVIQVTPGQNTILMTPGGKADWSHGRAGPGLEGVRSVNGEAVLPIHTPQSKARVRQGRA